MVLTTSRTRKVSRTMPCASAASALRNSGVSRWVTNGSSRAPMNACSTKTASRRRRHASWYCRVWTAAFADPSSRNAFVSLSVSLPMSTSPARCRTSSRSASMLHSIAPGPKHPPGRDVEVVADVDELVLLDVVDEVAEEGTLVDVVGGKLVVVVDVWALVEVAARFGVVGG